MSPAPDAHTPAGQPGQVRKLTAKPVAQAAPSGFDADFWPVDPSDAFLAAFRTALPEVLHT